MEAYRHRQQLRLRYQKRAGSSTASFYETFQNRGYTGGLILHAQLVIGQRKGEGLFDD